VLDEVIDEIFTTLTQRQTIRRLDTESRRARTTGEAISGSGCGPHRSRQLRTPWPQTSQRKIRLSGRDVAQTPGAEGWPV